MQDGSREIGKPLSLFLKKGCKYRKGTRPISTEERVEKGVYQLIYVRLKRKLENDMTIQYRGVKVTSNNSSEAKPFAGNYRGTQY